MQGAPLVRGGLVFVGVLLFALPLKWVTREEALERGLRMNPEEDLGRGSSVEGEIRALEMEFQFSREVRTMQIMHLGRELLKMERPSLSEVRTVSLPFPKEGIELVFRVEAEGKGVTAVRCRLRLPNGESYERSVWGADLIEEVIAFP